MLGLNRWDPGKGFYTPQFIKDNPLAVGVGIGQSYYQNGNRKNVVKFETTLRL